jgi:hypothetical protein
MSKTILYIESPKTQSIDAGKSLLALVGRSADPLPSDVSLDSGRLVLILSNKKDAYYTCTARACSCPGNQFRHNCKHMRKYFAEVAPSKPTKPADTGTSLIERGGFKPISLLPSEEAQEAKSASSLSVIDCHDTTPQDVAYWSIQEDKIMLPTLGEA